MNGENTQKQNPPSNHLSSTHKKRTKKFTRTNTHRFRFTAWLLAVLLERLLEEAGPFPIVKVEVVDHLLLLACFCLLACLCFCSSHSNFAASLVVSQKGKCAIVTARSVPCFAVCSALLSLSLSLSVSPFLQTGPNNWATMAPPQKSSTQSQPPMFKFAFGGLAG